MQLSNPRRLRSVLASVLLVSAASCTIHTDGAYHSSHAYSYLDDIGPTTLAEYENERGATSKFSIAEQKRRFPTGKNALEAAIIVARESVQEIPFLGLSVRPVDTKRAAEFGLEPWRGVLISKVEGNSAAAEAGLRRTDLLMTINGTPLVSDAQFSELVSGSLAPGDNVVFEVSRLTSEFARESLVVPVVVGSRTIEETEADRVKLPLNEALVHRAGIGVATIPADLALEIYGFQEAAALITAVVTGSSAYHAGFRTGDRIRRVNDIPVTTAAEIREILDQGSERLVLEVDGALGEHSGAIAVSENALEKSGFAIPIVVDYKARPERRSLKVLDFIFQFGLNKHTDYHLSNTREVKSSKFLSILPLGMFEFKRTPTRSTNRIFWFISWTSRR